MKATCAYKCTTQEHNKVNTTLLKAHNLSEFNKPNTVFNGLHVDN